MNYMLLLHLRDTLFNLINSEDIEKIKILALMHHNQLNIFPIKIILSHPTFKIHFFSKNLKRFMSSYLWKILIIKPNWQL